MMAAGCDAEQAAVLLAVDPAGLGGIALRAAAGPARDAWLARLRRALPPHAPVHRIPLHVDDDRLLGGLDLGATLAFGRLAMQGGLLAQCHGGLAIVAMAERLSNAVAAKMASVMDRGETLVERDGVSRRLPARLGIVALDEGLDDDERVPHLLLERLAFHVTLWQAKPTDGIVDDPSSLRRIDAARRLLGRVVVPDSAIEALCAAALALGIESMRPGLMAVAAARASAALDGRLEASEGDAALAARLVLGPRATRCPSDPSDEARDEPSLAESEPAAAHSSAEAQGQCPPPAVQASTEATPPATNTTLGTDSAGDRLQALSEPAPAPDRTNAGPLEDVVLQAALSTLPPRLLAALVGGSLEAGRRQSTGRSGAEVKGSVHGRSIGARRASARRGQRIDLLATLRAAAPWQGLRRAEGACGRDATRPRVIVRGDDFHVPRKVQRRETTTVFVVDASGSSALQRLAEAKGAVELLLADCYVRRDSVAVLAFRGQQADLLLPPTRSLVRAKRSLAGLPGGGGTPLSTAIDAATALAESIARKGATPVIVVLTDGRANVARNGAAGGEQPMIDAMESARRLRSGGASCLLIDTSTRAREASRDLARALGARYLPLPHADAAALSTSVRNASQSSVARR